MVKKIFILSIFLISHLFLNFGYSKNISPQHNSQNLITISSKSFSLAYNLKNGTYSILPINKNNPTILNATSFFTFYKSGGINSSSSAKRIKSIMNTKGNLGEGKTLVVENLYKGLTFVQEFTIYEKEEGDFLIIKAKIINTSNKTLKIAYFYPFSAAEKNSVFNLGNFKNVLILENGYDYFFDFYTRIIPASLSVKSNWNAAFYNFAEKKSVLLGFLTHYMSATKISTEVLSEEIKKNNNPQNISTFNKVFASCFLDPYKEVSPDESLESEVFFLDLTNKSPFTALERYARTVAIFTGKKIWADDIPNGWNSWGGGSGSGGYGQSINEELILKNLDFMAEKFKPFGMKYFQVDDGWQKNTGDWEANERFPHGMKWLAEQIMKRGLIPGIWIKAFLVDKKSLLLKTHPEWIAKKNNAGRKLISDNEEILDVSNPEVKKWFYELFKKISSDWGYKFIKLDFSYLSLFGKNHFETNKTNFEIYREGVQTLKQAISPDTFFLNVAIMGINYDLADAVRITLDNMPRWEDKMDMGAQGIKPTLRTLARRYYFQKNLWINHPDLLFFREPLKFNEALCWTSIVGLSGGIIKIGEKLVEMKDEWVEAVRKILPTSGESARPLDLFEREYPEKWVLAVKKNNFHWIVAGIFNWGKNINLQTQQPIAETERDYNLDFASLGLKKDKVYLIFSFWDEEFLGEKKNKISFRIKPRNHKILIIKEKEDIPQFLASNRHITGGAVEIKNIDYDKKNNILNCVFNSVPFYKQNFYFYIPPTYKITKLETNNTSWGKQVKGNLLKLNFVSSNDEVNFKLYFKK